MYSEFIKNIVFSIPGLKRYYIRRKELKGDFVKLSELNLDEAEIVLVNKPLNKELFVGLVKDSRSNFDGYMYVRDSYPKYERFLKNNNIKYEFYDIHKNDWLEHAQKYNVVIWHTSSSPASQTEAMQKIYILEKMGIKCMPSYDEVLKYEDKVLMHYFYKTSNLPEVPTFVSHSKEDAIAFAIITKYPIVSKITTGSASAGVEILKTQNDAINFINKVFSNAGRKTYWKYLRQKDYVYFQQFITDAKYDLRVLVVGNSLFGYYRFPKKGDFRASGANNIEKKAIPLAALDIAWETKVKYSAQSLATDFIYSPKTDKYYIIESSIFMGIDTPMQLVINGIPGRYIRATDGTYSFEKGKYWKQELELKSFFESF